MHDRSTHASKRTHRARMLLRESAERAFAQKGIAATAVEEIARGAGYSKGAFYGNYAGKHELLMDLLEELQLGSVRYWRMVMDSASDPAADLRALATLYDDVPHTAQRALLTAELQLEADRNPQFRATFAAYLDELNGEIRAAIGRSWLATAKACRIISIPSSSPPACWASASPRRPHWAVKSRSGRPRVPSCTAFSWA